MMKKTHMIFNKKKKKQKTTKKGAIFFFFFKKHTQKRDKHHTNTTQHLKEKKKKHIIRLRKIKRDLLSRAFVPVLLCPCTSSSSSVKRSVYYCSVILLFITIISVV